MKTILFFLISLSFYPSAQACRFEGMTLTSVEDSSEFTSTPSDWVAFPKALFGGYSDTLGEFSKAECKEAVIANQITDKKTGEVYTAFYTNDDSCDGGNSYGMIVRGLEPHPEMAIATIEDSDIRCLD